MGKHKYIKPPQKLWKLFEAYVKHEQENPMYKTEYVGKEGSRVKTPLETPITFLGFECYLADKQVITNLSNYETNADNSYDAYQPILKRIKDNCYVHNFKGAAAGVFHANLIARKLGISDKQQIEATANVNIINIDPLEGKAPEE